jgi:hypothetical protein
MVIVEVMPVLSPLLLLVVFCCESCCGWVADWLLLLLLIRFCTATMVTKIEDIAATDRVIPMARATLEEIEST